MKFSSVRCVALAALYICSCRRHRSAYDADDALLKPGLRSQLQNRQHVAPSNSSPISKGPGSAQQTEQSLEGDSIMKRQFNQRLILLQSSIAQHQDHHYSFHRLFLIRLYFGKNSNVIKCVYIRTQLKGRFSLRC